jgi:hypothetical protein
MPKEFSQLKADLEARGMKFISSGHVRMPLNADLKIVGKPTVADLATPEDVPTGSVTPQQEDYVHATFRALSKTVFMADVGRYRLACLDFTEGNVLKDAADFLTGETVYKDHDRTVDNWVGSVKKSFWSEKDEGIDVPGINADLKLDAKADYKTARGVASDPPTVRCCSSGVEFEFRKSHEELDDYDFWHYQGRVIEEGGEIVRCIVTKINDIYELSFVWSGADPNARKIDTDGASEDVEATRPNQSSSADLTSVNKNKEERTMEKTELERVRALLGNKAPAGIEDMEAGKVLSLVLAETDGLKTKLEAARTEVDSLKPQAELAKKMLDMKAAEVKRKARIAELGTSEGELSSIIESGIDAIKEDPEKLDAAFKEYEKKADKKLPHICSDCGSNNISRRSSTEVPLGDDTPGSGEFKRSPAGKALFGDNKDK